jgi:hypothetical protein
MTRRRPLAQLSLAALLALPLVGPGCAAFDTDEQPKHQQQMVPSEIRKPLAKVAAELPRAIEACGLTMEDHKFVDGVVTLVGVDAEGHRLQFRLSSVGPDVTRIEIKSLKGYQEGLSLQVMNALRTRVWG